ncbi:phage tail protein [Pedosphaera parvula]|uniref:Tail Collar domain protein n=1 Tax=Pedosphaera parvula (strain Ellin514) TaxID=320771 RepID=B9XBK6_PEDPL|nr:tail fiber protein [Pedosphaera parvula]EEF62891.1 Tail Collar domain protein [Pedosphaera parvula Ellin514]
MGSPFIGEIRLMACNFAPKGWALCNGQMLSIAQNSALFSILGTYYGGDGIRTFALPNLQGRAALHMGQGTGLSNYVIGQTGGVESVALATNQLPLHNHAVACNTTGGAQADPSGNYPGLASSNSAGIYEATSNNTMAAGVIGNTGGSQAHENRQPSLTLNYVIALLGIYPSRS